MDVGEAPEFELPEPGDGFQPPKRRLDPWAGVLTFRAPVVPHGPLINRAAARSRGVLRDMRREAQLAREIHKLARIVGLVGPDCPRAATPALHALVQEHRGDPALRAPVRRAGHRVDDQTVAILDHQIPQIREPRFVPCPLRYSLASGSVVDACVAFLRESA